MVQAPELNGATERFLIDREAVAAGIAIVLADAAGHAADAMPGLLVLSRGGEHFETRFRPYLAEVTHCLASALEAVLIASTDAERAGVGTARGQNEDALAAAVIDYLDRDRG